MKVNKTGKVSSMKSVKKPQATPGVSFSEIMANNEDDHERERFHQLVEDIQKKGKDLAESKTVEDLVAYKGMIREFLEDAVQFGLKVEERRGFGRRGRSKVFRVVSNIDEKLIELTDLILEKESPQLRLLNKIGEIQGLLINVFA